MTEPTEPHERLRHWMRQAGVAGVHEPAAATLATADGRGQPSARVVLVRGVSQAELQWFTNYDSQKGREIAENPRAALCFYWDVLRRQVRVQGLVRRLSEDDSDAYFAGRPRESQVAAWASQQSHVLSERQVLLDEFDRWMTHFGEREIPRPPHWGGFGLQPERWEFWINGEHRLHERIVYVRADGGTWEQQLLAP